MLNKAIWQNIINGDEAAYQQLYVFYFKKFYNYGRKFTANIALIEDGIQEVFLEIWNKRKQIINIDTPNSYFLAAFRYILVKKLKQAAATTHIEDIEEEPGFFIQPETDARHISIELSQQLQQAMQCLTPRQREAIFLRFYEELPYEQVAAVMNISVKATYKIIARSLQTLKTNLSLSLSTLMLLLRLIEP